MPNLILEAKVCNVVIQDPFPAEGTLSIQLEPAVPVTKYVSWSQFQRLRAQLASLEANGNLVYSVNAVAGEDIRSMEGDLLGLPDVTTLNTSAKPLTNGVVTGAILRGTNLLGGQTKASGTKGNLADTNGYIALTAVVPGAEGNDISVEFLTGAGESVAVVGNKISVTLNFGVSTYLSIETLLNADAVVKYMLLAAHHGTGLTAVAVEAETFLSGGVGGGIALSVGGIDAAFTSITNTAATYDIDLSALTLGDVYKAIYRCGSKVNQLTVLGLSVIVDDHVRSYHANVPAQTLAAEVVAPLNGLVGKGFVPSHVVIKVVSKSGAVAGDGKLNVGTSAGGSQYLAAQALTDLDVAGESIIVPISSAVRAALAGNANIYANVAAKDTTATTLILDVWVLGRQF